MKSIIKKYYSQLKQLEFLEPIKPAWRNLRRWFIARTTPLPKAPKNTHGNADQGDILDVYFNHKLDAFLNHKDSCISFKIDPKPLVSIIVLTYNKAALLLECLQSVVNHTHDSYEIIIADNASNDLTNELLDRIENAIVLRNSENLDFIRGNNAASKHAHGKYLLFLNHDTSVLPGWCDELSQLMESRNDVGAVGAKLIHMDGRLQESGCLVRKDGSTWGYGRSHANPNACEFNHVREVDFCSGAALMVRADLFRTLNGFDERYNPAYFEDV
ncbi:MAG: glycosyltransferase family 2 protein, partial [Gemmataceae bacterium]|nr:glycosyltransferase family 2 protein [Gemmataceae bacterium]